VHGIKRMQRTTLKRPVIRVIGPRGYEHGCRDSARMSGKHTLMLRKFYKHSLDNLLIGPTLQELQRRQAPICRLPAEPQAAFSCREV